MQLKEVIGKRRSIRFLLPYKPVEPEKIQRMLEAARIASHWGNVQRRFVDRMVRRSLRD